MGSCDTGIVTWYSLVLLSYTYVGDTVNLVLSACCWHWISCSISVVSTMLPFAVQTLSGWSAWCCLGARQSLHIPGLVWQLPCNCTCRPCLLLKRSRSSGFFPEPRVLLALLVMLMSPRWRLRSVRHPRSEYCWLTWSSGHAEYGSVSSCF